MYLPRVPILIQDWTKTEILLRRGKRYGGYFTIQAVQPKSTFFSFQEYKTGESRFGTFPLIEAFSKNK